MWVLLSQGGGLYSDVYSAASSSLTVTSTVFHDNVASIEGSAIYFSSQGDSLMTNCTFRNPGAPAESMIATTTVLDWDCNLGQYTPLGGTIFPVFLDNYEATAGDLKP